MTLKRTPMNRGTTPLRSTKPMARTSTLRAVSTTKKAAPAPRAAMKSKQLAVTKSEKAVWSQLAALGCIACMKDGRYNPHVSIHHVDGRTKPGCHLLVLPLCGPHHQDDGSGAIAVHPWKAQFEARYGAQLDLVAECMALITKQKRSSENEKRDSGLAVSGQR